MANLAGFIDPTAEAPKPGGALPAGWYLATITESELRENYNKDGEEFSFTYEVQEGECRGRKFWHTIATTGDSSRVGKGQGELNAMIAACGIKGMPGDTQELHYKPHWVRLSFVAAGTLSGSGRAYQKDRNFLNEWRALEGQTVVTGGQGNAPAAAQQPSQPTTAPSDGSPPWAQRAA